MVWYSVKYKASNTALYMERNIDYLILGKTFSANALGYYAFAYNIMYTPVKRISYIFSDILFPTFSSFKNNSQKIIRGYLKSVQLIAIVSFPGMTLLALNAEWLIPFVFGDQWTEAIPVVQILCFAGAIQSVSQVGGVIFTSIGKPEITLYISAVRTVFVVIAILAGSLYGIVMVAWLIVAAKSLSLLVMLSVIKYIMRSFNFREYINYLAGPTFSVAVLLLVQYGIDYYSLLPEAFIKFLLMSVMALGIILLCHYRLFISLYQTYRG